MFDKPTLEAIGRIATRLGVEPAALLAVAEIESGGVAFAMVRGKAEPLIRWEGHYFDKRLKGDQRETARRQGLASPDAGAIPNPKGQAIRWERLFLPATKISQLAAFESTSWGIGQVMGAHWRVLGFDKPGEMLTMVRSGVVGQVEVMARYIEKFALADELRRLDFPAFTRGYNGPGGIKAGYHNRMAESYRRWSGGNVPVSTATGMLRMGSKGAKVRELQALLVRAGHSVKVDGDYGPSTRDAVKRFQVTVGIAGDGVAGPETFRKLEAFRATPDEAPGTQSATDVKEVRDAAKALGPLAIVMSVRDQLAETATGLLGIDVAAAQTVASALMVTTGAIGVGLALWGFIGWWKSRQTEEQPA